MLLISLIFCFTSLINPQIQFCYVFNSQIFFTYLARACSWNTSKHCSMLLIVFLTCWNNKSSNSDSYTCTFAQWSCVYWIIQCFPFKFCNSSTANNRSREMWLYVTSWNGQDENFWSKLSSPSAAFALAATVRY